MHAGEGAGEWGERGRSGRKDGEEQVQSVREMRGEREAGKEWMCAWSCAGIKVACGIGVVDGVVVGLDTLAVEGKADRGGMTAGKAQLSNF